MIYNPWFAHAGVDAVVVPMGVEAGDYPAFLPLLFRLRNVMGALVTMPHKATTAGLVDRLSPAAAVAGACNAIRLGPDGRLEGDMFDGEGFVRGMRRKGRRLEGAAAIVIGAGGVGSAIAAALAAAGASRLALFDIAPGRAEALAGRIAKVFPAVALETGRNDPSGFDIVVNATPLGMEPGDPLPTDAGRIAPDAFVGEVVMAAAETPFLAAARARGCATQIGLDMNYEQIPAYLEFFDLPTTTPEELRRRARVSVEPRMPTGGPVTV